MKRIAIIAIGILCLLFIYNDQNRDFYCFKESGKCITYWKRIGGKCYIVFGEYKGFFSPKKNYLLTTNANSLTIVDDPTSQYKLVVRNNYGLPLKNISENECFYVYQSKDDFFEKYYVNNRFIGYPYEFILINIMENTVSINGERKKNYHVF